MLNKNFIPKHILMKLFNRRLESKDEGHSFANCINSGWNNNGGNRGWEDWEIEDMNRPGYELTADGGWRPVNQ